MKQAQLLLVGILLSAASTTATAQAPPFFGGGGIFDPEIDVVSSGVILDAQAVVSADRKYVTMTMRPSSTELLAIREFAFQVGGGGGGGFVGGAGQGTGGGAAANPAPADQPVRAAGPAAADDPGTRFYGGQQKKDPRILERQGMTLLGRVDG